MSILKFAGSPYGTYGPAKEILAEAHARHYEAEAENSSP
jgi:hypothetical protein